MANEIEVKILKVNPREIISKLEKLKAKQTFKGRLIVDWYRTAGTKEGDDQWYLRIRTYSNGVNEVTWKGLSQKSGTARKHKEINILIEDADKLGELFTLTGLEKYGHQEKDRVSFQFKNLKFDLDTYPKMPSYLEIESSSDKKIKAGIKLLDLEDKETSSEGERILIQDKYGLDWYDMRF